MSYLTAIRNVSIKSNNNQAFMKATNWIISHDRCSWNTSNGKAKHLKPAFL